MINIENKRILLIGPIGQYITAISDSLSRNGAIIDVFEERPSLSFLIKLAIRYFNNLIVWYSQKYFNSILNKTKDKDYDYIFMIRAEGITKKFILDLKKEHPRSKVILYQWDSMRHTKAPIKLLPYFDFKFSFDKLDCANYNLEFLPLFYIEDYKNLKKYNEANTDFLFIGTIHSERYKILSKIGEIARRKNKTTFFYMYITSIVGFYKLKYIDRCLPSTKINDFEFKFLNKKSVIERVADSKIIIDSEHTSQLGLTIRTIESVGAKRKLITTNADIVNYDFYNSNNILIVDRKNPIIPDDFIHNDYEELPEVIYERYSLDSWLSRIFDKVSN